MMKGISEEELIKWANTLIEPSFLDKDIIVEQIHSSQMYIKERYEDACYIGFNIFNDVRKYPHNVTVPVSIVTYKENGTPIEFLLFLSDGLVDEIEIVSYDAMELEPLDFDFSNREYLISEAVRV